VLNKLVISEQCLFGWFKQLFRDELYKWIVIITRTHFFLNVIKRINEKMQEMNDFYVHDFLCKIFSYFYLFKKEQGEKN
jgi:hypothetical protein